MAALSGNVPDQVGQGLEQTGIVEGVPAYSRILKQDGL